MRLLSCSLYDTNGDEVLLEVTRADSGVSASARLVIDVLAERFAPDAASPRSASQATLVYDGSRAEAQGARHGIEIDAGDGFPLTMCAVNAVANAVVRCAGSGLGADHDVLWEAVKKLSPEILLSTVRCLRARLSRS